MQKKFTLCTLAYTNITRTHSNAQLALFDLFFDASRPAFTTVPLCFPLPLHNGTKSTDGERLNRDAHRVKQTKKTKKPTTFASTFS